MVMQGCNVDLYIHVQGFVTKRQNVQGKKNGGVYIMHMYY